MKIEKKKISELNFSAYNPRIELKDGDVEFEKLKNSIANFGNVEPIVWNKRTGNVVGGHQRLSALKSLGEIETEVSVVDLSLEDEKLLNIALNKIKGEFDYDLLADVLKDFEEDELSLSGFSPNELSIILADENETSEFDYFENADDEEDLSVNGKNYVVVFTFETTPEALEWLKEHNWENHYVKNKHTISFGVGIND